VVFPWPWRRQWAWAMRRRAAWPHQPGLAWRSVVFPHDAGRAPRESTAARGTASRCPRRSVMTISLARRLFQHRLCCRQGQAAVVCEGAFDRWRCCCTRVMGSSACRAGAGRGERRSERDFGPRCRCRWAQQWRALARQGALLGAGGRHGESMIERSAYLRGSGAP